MESNTNILIWNLRYFGINKVTPNVPDFLANDPMWSIFSTKGYNDIALSSVVRRMNPDIFVVLEVQSGPGKLGTLVEGTGQQGLSKLYVDLQLINSHWRLIPAVRLNNPKRTGARKNYTEGIGVFYRSDRLQFTGPLCWPQDATKPQVAIPIGSAPDGLYPQPWQFCLPPDQATLAGQVIYRDDQKKLIGFPIGGLRKPFLTTFRELHHAGRDIRLVSTHMPSTNADRATENRKSQPTGSTAKRALQKIMRLVPGTSIPPAGSVSIVAGDFNINRNDPAITKDLYAKTFTTPEDWLFQAPAGSMYKRITKATPDNYLGLNLLDNAVVRYAPDLGPPRPHRGMIPDIAGNATMYIDGTDPATYPPVPATMTTPIDFILQDIFLDASPLETFRAPDNYAHIAHEQGLSDHRPIYFEV